MERVSISRALASGASNAHMANDIRSQLCVIDCGFIGFSGLVGIGKLV